MKKTAAILLLGILLFNWVGYRFITAYLEAKANQQLNANLDDNLYSDADLVSIKIVNILPYTNSKEYKRISGQLEIAGVQYNYVKMKMAADSLELLCIPNHDVTKMRSAKDEFFKLVNDLEQNGQTKKTGDHSGSLKNFSVDAYTFQEPFAFHAGLDNLKSGLYADFAFVIPSCYAPTAEQPPDIS